MSSSGAPPTPLTLAALALLAERPMHPYEMYQLSMQRRDHRLVKIRPGTLYHAVRRLAESGLVAVVGTEREGNRPERTTYEITDAGRDHLQSSVALMLAQVAAEYPVFPFALGEAHNLPEDEVIRLLTTRRSALRETLGEIEAGIGLVRGKNLPWAYWLQLEYLHTVLSAQASWLESAITDIGAGRFTVPATFTSLERETTP
jgi:DNA-binding PadR family transcriptional regulator